MSGWADSGTAAAPRRVSVAQAGCVSGLAAIITSFFAAEAHSVTKSHLMSDGVIGMSCWNDGEMGET
jgi:hypothetical protein